LAALYWFPPEGGLSSSPGPLARPHVRAKLECNSCHLDGKDAAALASAPGTPGKATDAKPSAKPLKPNACAGCHGAHPSARPGHQRLAAAQGFVGCAGCHTIHRGDQGVAFTPDAPPIRFAPGSERELDGPAFHPPRPATVPLVTAGSCKGCHALDAPADPIARCLLPGQERFGDARPIVCFDEHQDALPSDRAVAGGGDRGGGRGRGFDPNEPRPPEPSGTPPRGGVCAGQHGTDRALAWDAARSVASSDPVLGAGATSSGRPALWLGAGLAAAALVLGGVRGGAAARARLRRKKTGPTQAMLAPAARVRLPQIDVTTCLGCYACVDACPYDVLEIERYVAVLARPEACCGLTLCEQRCPNGSLKITDGEPIGDRPRLSDALESLDMPGLFLAGDVTGLPLIKNAIAQGAAAVGRIARSLQGAARAPDGVLDLLIVGAGPAGISAALMAKDLGLRFEVLEQGSVAQSIKSFPRGKLVFDQPLELPVAGKLWLRESTKEELLTQWMRIVRQERLPIRQDTRMASLAKDGDVFRVVGAPRDGGPEVTLRARRVLLAIGQRGQPRRLPFELSTEVESRVHYHLADARSFEGKRVIVVGLGDVAMEAAIALGRQPSTTVVVAYRGTSFRRGKSRNIEELKRMADSGRVSMLFETEITEITPDSVLLRGPGGPRTLPYDAVLVMIGNIPPWNTLRGAGVRTHAEVPREDRSPAPSVQEEARPA
jgi:thioredoxin reductase